MLNVYGNSGYVIVVEDDLNSNRELGNLAENFREQASKLVDMLDVSIPVVSKLKVVHV
jgi:hypothetical protein